MVRLEKGGGLEMVRVTISWNRKILRVTITIEKAAKGCN